MLPFIETFLVCAQKESMESRMEFFLFPLLVVSLQKELLILTFTRDEHRRIAHKHLSNNDLNVLVPLSTCKENFLYHQFLTFIHTINPVSLF